MDLPYNQNGLIMDLRQVNKKLVVINIRGTGVAMPWKNQAWYLGSETGNVWASILMGDVSPSGKLPYTYYAGLDQCGAHRVDEYPGHKGVDALGNEVYDIPYNEGLFVGYRFIDKNKLTPNFPFGHGLSYTTFEYGNPKVSSTSMDKSGQLCITLPITNTGKRVGAEVIQLYIKSLKFSVIWLIKELKGFCKVELQPNETKEGLFTITAEELSYFDDKQHKWAAEPGKYEALIASSSADIRSKVCFELK